MKTNDNELLGEYVKCGDSESFEQLVRRHSNMVFRVCHSLLWRHEDAEDAFQAVFLLLSKNAANLTSHQSVGGWLHVTATRTCMQLRRKIARNREIEMNTEPAKYGEPWEAISKNRECELLYREIARLPRKHRDVIVLYHFEGKSRSQIADLLDCTTIAVKAMLARARKTLRHRMIRHGMSASIVLAVSSRQVEACVNVSESLIQSTLDHCLRLEPTAGVGSGTEIVESIIEKDMTMGVGTLKNLVIAATLAGFAEIAGIGAVASGKPQVTGSTDAVVLDESQEKGEDEKQDAVQIKREKTQKKNDEKVDAVDLRLPVAQRLGLQKARPAAQPVQVRPWRTTRADPNSMAGVRVKNFKSNGKRIRYKRTKTQVEQKEMEYTVRIPFVENGETKFKEETRTRIISSIKQTEINALVPMDSTFESIDGKTIDHAEANKMLGNQETAVILLPAGKSIPEIWKQLLRPDALIFHTDAEQEPVGLPVPNAINLPQGGAAVPPAGIRKAK